jgi:mannose-6-phosphate isomerase-like protein (cupin superfamily)
MIMDAPIPLPNVVLDDAQAKFIAEDCGDHRIYFDGPTDLMKIMVAGSLRLKPGMTPHPPHQHPEEEFMLVTEGTGEIFCDGETTQVRPGSMMYCAGGKFHAIVNTGQTPMLFYYYKWLP